MARIGHIGLSVFHQEPVWINWLDVDKKKIPVPEVGSGNYYQYGSLPNPPNKGGAGIILGEISGGRYIGGVDLDGCLVDGALAGWAEEIVEELGSYTEISPSGLGVKIFFIMTGKAAGTRLPRKQVPWPKHSSQGKAWGIETYIDGQGTRFFTVTDRVFGSHREVNEIGVRKLKWVGEKMKEFETAGKLQKRVIKAMSFIKNDDIAWEQWNEIGMALFNATLGSPAGFEAWAAFSMLSSKYTERETRERWEHWKRSPAENLGMRDVERAATRYGYQAEDDLADMYDCRNDIEDMNKKYAHIKFGRRMFVLIDRPSMWTLYDLMEEKHWMAMQNGFTKKFGMGKDLRQLHEIWVDSRYRRQYGGVGLYPPMGMPCPDDYFNLWRGWNIRPQKPALVGGWERFKQHLYYIVCGGNTEYWRYLRRWMAYKIQYPGKKAGTAIVLKGEKGAGKTVVADYLSKIFGVHFVRVAQHDQLLGKHNSHLEHALLVNAEEAFWAGSKKDEGILKDLITSDTMIIEPKGIDARTVPNRMDLLITSNADWVVPASADERRYFSLDVSSEKRNDGNYFKALFTEMEGNGPSAMLFDMLAEDLGDYHPRAIVSTESLWEQKLISMDFHERFIYELGISGRVPGMTDGMLTSKDTLYGRYKSDAIEAHVRGLANDVVFCKLLYKLGCWRSRPRVDGNQITAIQFPNLAEFRTALDAMWGHIGDWDDKGNWFVWVAGEKKGNLDFPDK